MKVEKKPTDNRNFSYGIKFFASARLALKKTLLAYRKCKGEFTIFLPEYIGRSPKEGSGIFDPVCELKLNHVFYSFTDDLTIDVCKLRQQLKGVKGRVVFLMVHYFGYIDPNYDELILLLKKNDVFIIEDGAHAMYTHIVDSKCGLGNCILYSFHKMLPLADGGAVLTKDFSDEWWNKIVSEEKIYPFYRFDLVGISQKRKNNALLWYKLLEGSSRYRILRERDFYVNQTPQSFPILLKCADRYEVYKEMNRLGYGVISLYHTMIEPIKKINSLQIKLISETILNLPVHQDIGEKEILEMYDILIKLT